MTVRLSIIIPAYNEADRIRPALDACDRLCDTLPFESEIIVVDDGSTDDSAETVTSLGSLRVRLIRHTDNRGKGAAVRTGMLAASGTYRLFTDADNSTPIAFALPFIKRLDSGADVVIGSRRLPGSRILHKQKPTRDVLGALFRSFTRMLFSLNVSDTQAGFKAFTAAAAKRLFSEAHVSGFCFDIEVLMLARHHGLRIVEFPIDWTNDRQSRVRIRDMIRMLWDLILLRLRFR